MLKRSNYDDPLNKMNDSFTENFSKSEEKRYLHEYNEAANQKVSYKLIRQGGL